MTKKVHNHAFVALCMLFAGTIDVMALDIPDPTIPSGYQPAQKSPWRLESVISGPNRKMAVINGRIMQEGESINGAILSSIGDDAVLLTRRGKTIQIQIDNIKARHSLP